MYERGMPQGGACPLCASNTIAPKQDLGKVFLRTLQVPLTETQMFRLFSRLFRQVRIHGTRSAQQRARRRVPSFRPLCELLERRDVPSVVADFNGDGFSDLAVGVSGENNNAGAVNVIYGSASGLTSTGNQVWTENSLGETSSAGDRFGISLAAGDFDNDGFADLAI